MADPTVLDVYRRELTPELYTEVRELYKTHSIAEDARDLPGLISTLTPDCVYEIVGTGHRWEGHEGAARFYTQLLTAFPDIRFDLTGEPEFDRWRWVDYWQPVKEVIYFKRPVYVRALHELAPLATSPDELRFPLSQAFSVARALVIAPSGMVMLSSPPGTMLKSASTLNPCTKSPDVVTSWLAEFRLNEPSRVNRCSAPWMTKNPLPSMARSVAFPVGSMAPLFQSFSMAAT